MPDSAWALLPQVVGQPDTIERVPPDGNDVGDRGGVNFRKQVNGQWLVATHVRTKRGNSRWPPGNARE